MKGKLVLVPIPLGDCSLDYSIPTELFSIIRSLDYFVVENIRTARRYIRKTDPEKNIDGITFFVLNKHTDPSKIPGFLDPLRQGMDVGLISEAGVPGVADPGANIVNMAHKEGIRVVPMVGPSSIILALMASGMNGQNFAFRGYLPIKDHAKTKALKTLEQRSKTENQTQIFMEAPYRNNKLVSKILETCRDNTYLCIASNITLDGEYIQTKTIAEWKKNVPELNKKPTIFLLQAELK